MSELIIEQYILPLATSRDKLQEALWNYEWEVGYDLIIREQDNGILVTRLDIGVKFSSALHPHNPQHQEAIRRKYPGFRRDSLSSILTKHGLDYTPIDF